MELNRFFFSQKASVAPQLDQFGDPICRKLYVRTISQLDMESVATTTTSTTGAELVWR